VMSRQEVCGVEEVYGGGDRRGVGATKGGWADSVDCSSARPERSSIRRLFENAGGVRPAPRRRAERHLTLLEREEISRGVGGSRGRPCDVGSGFQVLEHSGHMLAVSAAGDQPTVLGVAFVVFHRGEREEDGAMHVGGRCRCDHRSCSEARLNNASGVAMNVG